MQNSTQTHKALLELPEPILQGIGSIVFQWALFDHHLTKAISILFDIDIKKTRSTLGTMKVMSKLDTIEDLLLNLKLDEIKDEVSGNRETLQQADSIRNLLAHGPWVRNEEGELIVISYSGKWKPDGKDRVRKRVQPIGAPVTEDWLNQNLVAFVGANRWMALVLQRMIDALPSSPNRFL